MGLARTRALARGTRAGGRADTHADTVTRTLDTITLGQLGLAPEELVSLQVKSQAGSALVM